MAVNISSVWCDDNNFIDSIAINNTEYTSNTGLTITAYSGMQITLTCKDGYSFNPENEETPVISLTKGISGVWIKGLGTQEFNFSNYSLNDDYTKITFTINDSDFISYLNYGINSYARWYPIYYSNYCNPTQAKTTKYYSITQNLTGVTTDITETEIEENTSLTGTFTLITGYENLSYSIVMGDTTITGTNTTFTIDNVTDNVTITAYATKKVFTITNQLTKCELTSGVIPSSADYGDSIIFTVKPVTGYTKIISAYYLNDNGDKTDIHINSSGYVSTVITIYENIHIFISAEQSFTVTETLTNIISASSNPKEVIENESFILQYEPETGYLIDTLTCNIGTVTISSDKTYATITGTATENITVVGTGKKIYTVNLTGTFENCTCNYSDGETVDITKPLAITANSGYEFLSVYKYKQGVITHSLAKSDDNTTLTCSFEDGYNYTFNDNYNATKQVEKIGTFCNLYNVTNDELTALSKKRFVDSEGTTVDYGSFITQLYILPLDVPNDILGDTSTIILGNYDSTVESTLLNTYSCEVDLGTITVPEKYNNVYDYLNTTCTLRLPFFNPIILDVDNVINKTVTIKLVVDFYSGNVTVNIYSTFTNSIIESQTMNIVTQIPFIQKQNNGIVNQLSNVNKNLIDTAQIEVVRNIPYYTTDIFGKNTIDYGLISSVTGYCEISDIDLVTTATNDEKEQIKTLLNKGVFINAL